MKDYEAKIAIVGREIGIKERIAIKNLNDAEKLTAGELITLTNYAIIDVHNEKASGEKDYRVCVLCDADGTRHYTSSDSFIRSLDEIFDELIEEKPVSDWLEEGLDIKVCESPSKNFSGNFYTCVLV